MQKISIRPGWRLVAESASQRGSIHKLSVWTYPGSSTFEQIDKSPD